MLLPLLILLFFVSFALFSVPLPVEKLTLPKSYAIDIFATGVTNGLQ
jgi:hypothetical protein